MDPYVALLILFGFATAVGGGFIVISHLIGPKKENAVKGLPYECGVESVDEPRRPFSVKFYLVAMLFIVFDIEVVFLYPWAVNFKEFVRSGMGTFVFVEMAIFLGILVAGLLYVYGKRAIDWD
jgi:NADH-quinone oxidoreductase subunit A